ncbi:SURF1 family protein [Cognatishimia sp. WU-CL00825]|uniref:SURF1 family protein n=1 Tax=Cognatishimia sp. WU-CL00825 TaxID=3127658 RepID=UPI0031062BEC
MRRLILPLTFGILGTAILLSLGSWQVRRLAWKENVLAQIDRQIAAEPVALPVELDPDADKFLAVTVQGLITQDEVHVLASTRDTGAIYRVIAAFETTDGRRVLLDRGWVYPPSKDAQRPMVQTTVQGNLHWPQEVDSYTPENDTNANIWFSRHVPTLAKALDTEEILVVARSTTEKDPQVTPLPVASSGIPNDHLQYAVTWYGLAAVWVMMTLYYLRRMRKQKKV